MNELGNTPADKNYKPSGISRAEEAASKAYPIEICGYVTECRVGAKPEPQDWNEERRKCFQEGYEAAEKDLALTWKDIKTIVQILADSDWYDFEINGKLWSEDFYKEVLKRYEQKRNHQ